MRLTTWCCGLVLAATLALPGTLPAQVPPRRQALEQQVMQRFLQRAMNELALPEAARPRLVEAVRTSAAERRALNLEAAQLRRRLVLAVQDSTTPEREFEALLEAQRRLREREHELWLREQARLEEVLSPREQAHFSILWLRLQEEARLLMLQRQPPPPRRRD